MRKCAFESEKQNYTDVSCQSNRGQATCTLPLLVMCASFNSNAGHIVSFKLLFSPCWRWWMLLAACWACSIACTIPNTLLTKARDVWSSYREQLFFGYVVMWPKYRFSRPRTPCAFMQCVSSVARVHMSGYFWYRSRIISFFIYNPQFFLSPSL